jgi:hypothetical protein
MRCDCTWKSDFRFVYSMCPFAVSMSERLAVCE